VLDTRAVPSAPDWIDVTKSIVFAVAGGGDIKPETVESLLDHFLEVDTDNPRDVAAVYLPADVRLTTSAVRYAARWMDDVGLPYIAVRGDRPGRFGREIADGAQEVITGESVVDALRSHKDDDVDIYLLLAWGDDPEQAADVETEDLLTNAHESGITVLDLNAGLDEIVVDDGSEDQDDEQPSEFSSDVDDEPGPSDDKSEAPDLPELNEETQELEPTDEAQATIRPSEPTEKGESDVPDLVTTLSFVYLAMSSLDRAIAALRMEHPRFSPITRVVRHHLHQMLKDDLPSTVDELDKLIEETRPKLRGKPRDTSSDEVNVLIDRDKKTIRLAGRGRPRKGEVQERMTRAEFERLAADWGS